MTQHRIGLNTAISIVVANMIGTGVFTSLGFQVTELSSGFSILMLWIVGGIIALCGALCYAEIGSAIPGNGGEYNYLSRLYHPAVGFISGWVSVAVGFAAVVAATAVALSEYTVKIFPEINATLLSFTVIILITAMHAINLRLGALFQRVFTYLKVISILVFIVFGLFHTPSHVISFSPSVTSSHDIFSAAFATALIFVTYSYSGWNAATYISGEMNNVNKNLPRALIIGTVLVAVVYTLLNFVFLYTVPTKELEGVLEIGFVSAAKVFRPDIAKLMSLVIAVLLVSSVSAMIMAGPRVMQRMGEEVKGLGFFAKLNRNQVPFVSIIFQSLIALVLVYTSSFKSLITYVSFTLNLFTFFTVLGLFILRIKYKHLNTTFKTPFYPLTPLVFLGLMLWILYNIILTNPIESLYSLLTVLFGLSLYFITKVSSKSTEIISESKDVSGL